MIIGNHEFDTGNRCYIVGILNLTPDSFSDGGKWNTSDAALRHVEDMIADGADMIDIGGESSRPGHTAITARQEMDRILPVIEALRGHFGVPLSIDTCKSGVADAALRAGADLVNDIWGLRKDPEMGSVIARAGAACCLVHNRKQIDYTDFLPDILSDLRESAGIALKAGIAEDKLILDPGIGFAKSLGMDLEAINRLDEIRSLGYPVLLGASRKSFIGRTLGLPETERVEGSLAAAIIGIMRGCSFIRVHDVRGTKRAVMMAEAIIKT